MRRLLTLAFLLTFSFAAFAQQNSSSLISAKIKDGSIMLGGNLGASYQKFSRENLNTKKKETGDLIEVRFATKTGYFFLPDFAVGINAAVEHTSINIDSTRFGAKNTYLLAGPFVRYYLNNGLFGELNVNAGVNTVKGGNKTDIKSAAVGIGYAYFLNDRIAIEPLLSFNYVQGRVDNPTFNTKDSQFGPVLNIGVQAYLWAPTRVLPTK
ncbi:outer membrane beta-barrel protein [Adhaeribacter terreus]|uniref:Outer membrane beta-barrel protein n=1 Tax=Adhaeribacter terreus TaxID=529703 RepID=A0ABW0EBM2_9BACT